MEKETEAGKERKPHGQDHGMCVRLSVQALRILDLSPSGSLHPIVAWKCSISETINGPLRNDIRAPALTPTPTQRPMLILTITKPGTGNGLLHGHGQPTNIHVLLDGLRMCYLSRFLQEVQMFLTEGCIKGIEEAIEQSYSTYHSINYDYQDMDRKEEQYYGAGDRSSGRNGTNEVERNRDSEIDKDRDRDRDRENESYLKSHGSNNFVPSSTFRRADSDPSCGTSGSGGSNSSASQRKKNDNNSNDSDSNENRNNHLSATNSSSSSRFPPPSSPSTSPSSSSTSIEWKIDFTDTLIIAPRNTWSMDTIAVAVSTATLEGMYVPESWSAPQEVSQSDSGKYLYFDPRSNIWLFEPETPYAHTHSPSPGPGPIQTQRKSSITKQKQNLNQNSNQIPVSIPVPAPSFTSLSSPLSLSMPIKHDLKTEITNEKILRSTSSLARLFNDQIIDENRKINTEVSLPSDLGISVELELDKEISEDSYSDGRTSSKHGSMYSMASSLYKSCDDLDKDNDDGRNEEGQGEGEKEDRSICQSQKSLLSSYDGHDDDGLFFDAFDSSPLPTDEKKASVRFAIPPMLGKNSRSTDTEVGTDRSKSIKEEHSKRKVKEVEKEVRQTKKHVPILVSRTVLTLRKTEVFVSLANPLDPFRVEECVEDLREFCEVSHHSPVYRGVLGKMEGDERGRDRDKDRDTESVFVQRYVESMNGVTVPA